jgi:hypothetical protein
MNQHNDQSKCVAVLGLVWSVFIGLAGMLALFSMMVGCAGVEPYEREYLADPIMQVEPTESDAYAQHMYRALNQGLTGQPAAGGGCGCEQ